MRVLQSIDTLGGGGAERQLTYLVEGLLRLDHEVDVVYMLDGPHGARLRASGATIHDLGGWRSPWRLVAELCGIIARRRVDVVQTWLLRMNVAGGVAGRLSRRPWLYSERSIRQLDQSGWHSSVRKWLARGASAVVANSEAGAEGWRRAAAAVPVHVVPNAVDLEAIAAAPAATRAELGLADDAELIVYAGRFVAPKNIPLLAGALAAVLARRGRAVALCCGDGQERDWFRAAVERAGVGARCLTPGYRPDVWALLKAADVTIAPSLHEGRPNVVLEAMACGCPLALSDIAQHHECVPADGALWFSPFSAAEAAGAMERALDDRRAARDRAARALEAVRGQSVDAMARAYAQIYQRLVGPIAGGRLRA